MSESEGLRSEAPSRRFDPRFSPAFQPGYDPRVHREAPPSAPLRDEPRDWPERDWPETRREAQSTDRERSEDEGDLSIFAIPDERAAEPEELAVEGVGPTPWWHRVNPWLVVLWVLGIAIVLLSFQFANAVAEGAFQPNPNDPSGYLVSMLPQMVIFGLPTLICLGLATFVTPFVILAARWRR